MSFALAARTQRMNPSAIRDILKVTERPGILSMAGGLPAPEAFPVEAIRRASDHVLGTQGAAALQYASSEGLPGLREWVAGHLSRPGWRIDPDHVLITTGSQQGLDLLGKVLLDEGAHVLVEQPTYLGALQAFTPYGPVMQPWAADAEGPLADELVGDPGAAVAYLIPNFQNPGGQCLGEARRQALAQALPRGHTLLIEDDPYGALWYDAPPPAPVASGAPQQVVYLGSFSKVLSPGLRVGYMVMPGGEGDAARALRSKLLQAKQACDLHTPGLNQRLILELLQGGFDLEAHLHQVRERYRLQRDVMAHALATHLPRDCRWHVPPGGMFFWVEAPEHVDTLARLPRAVKAGVAYVPGAPFFSSNDTVKRNALRLSFVTLAPAQIEEAVARLGPCLA
jgi:2-aminoadipate transaminase